MNITLKMTEKQFDALHELMKAEARNAVAEKFGSYENTDGEYQQAYDLLVEEVEK